MLGDEIAFVHDDEAAFFLVELFGVVGEIFAIEEEGSAAVDDLDENVGPLRHSPKLSPHLDILLIGGDV